jgi:hypothetical protein
MKDNSGESVEQWDDVPAKVVGRRSRGSVDLECGEAFLLMGKAMGIKLMHRPKGVFRYASFDEADE